MAQKTKRIIKCSTFAKAKKVNDASYEIFKQRAIDAGYDVDVNGYIIGRNAATGLPAPHKNRIKKWDDVKTDEVDGKPYIKELDNLTTSEIDILDIADNTRVHEEKTIEE